MQPKIATDIPATIIVVCVAPSQTISKGARADFGKLLRTTRKGSTIADKLGLNHKRITKRRLRTVTKKKLKRVSYSVIPI